MLEFLEGRCRAQHVPGHRQHEGIHTGVTTSVVKSAFASGDHTWVVRSDKGQMRETVRIVQGKATT
jgi:hypothetical protein